MYQKPGSPKCYKNYGKNVNRTFWNTGKLMDTERKWASALTDSKMWRTMMNDKLAWTRNEYSQISHQWELDYSEELKHSKHSAYLFLFWLGIHTLFIIIMQKYKDWSGSYNKYKSLLKLFFVTSTYKQLL